MATGGETIGHELHEQKPPRGRGAAVHPVTSSLSLRLQNEEVQILGVVDMHGLISSFLFSFLFSSLLFFSFVFFSFLLFSFLFFSIIYSSFVFV
jgi:hypothetical protein